MGTVNGFGTMYYGWRHAPDGTATATKSLVGVWLPIVPLARHHLRVLTDFSKREPFLQIEKRGFCAGAAAVQRTEYQRVGQGRISAREVATTYLWTYVVGTILVAWPMLLFWGMDRVLDGHPAWRQTNAVMYAGLVLGVILIANPITVGLIALRRARGFKGGLLE